MMNTSPMPIRPKETCSGREMVLKFLILEAIKEKKAEIRWPKSIICCSKLPMIWLNVAITVKRK